MKKTVKDKKEKNKMEVEKGGDEVVKEREGGEGNKRESQMEKKMGENEGRKY